MRALLSTFLLLLLSACASVPSLDSSGRERIAAATKAWQVAYDSRDPKAIVSQYDAESVLWGTTAKVIAPNPEALWAYFKNAASRPNARVEFGEQHIRVFGDAGVNSGYYTFTDVRDGQVTRRPARYTLVFRSQAGKWLVVAHHSSAMP